MKRRNLKPRILVLALTLAFVGRSPATEECDVKHIDFQINDIFDTEDPDTIVLHEWANLLHISTKTITLTNETAFFMDKCSIVAPDLEELERHLRGLKYIRDARVSVSETDSDTIEVETWDNWSMMPTIDFGRKGEKTSMHLG